MQDAGPSVHVWQHAEVMVPPVAEISFNNLISGCEVLFVKNEYRMADILFKFIMAMRSIAFDSVNDGRYNAKKESFMESFVIREIGASWISK